MKQGGNKYYYYYSYYDYSIYSTYGALIRAQKTELVIHRKYINLWTG